MAVGPRMRRRRVERATHGGRQIAAGSGHILALKSDGTVWAWGSNAHGELGDGTNENSLEPVQVAGLTGVKAISAGKGFSLALKG